MNVLFSYFRLSATTLDQIRLSWMSYFLTLDCSDYTRSNQTFMDVLFSYFRLVVTILNQISSLGLQFVKFQTDKGLKISFYYLFILNPQQDI